MGDKRYSKSTFNQLVADYLRRNPGQWLSRTKLLQGALKNGGSERSGPSPLRIEWLDQLARNKDWLDQHNLRVHVSGRVAYWRGNRTKPAANGTSIPTPTLAPSFYAASTPLPTTPTKRDVVVDVVDDHTHRIMALAAAGLIVRMLPDGTVEVQSK